MTDTWEGVRRGLRGLRVCLAVAPDEGNSEPLIEPASCSAVSSLPERAGACEGL